MRERGQRVQTSRGLAGSLSSPTCGPGRDKSGLHGGPLYPLLKYRLLESKQYSAVQFMKQPRQFQGAEVWRWMFLHDLACN